MQGRLAGYEPTPGTSAIAELGALHRDDRRRSDRLEVSLSVRLDERELVNVVELSLGGATIETASRPSLHVPRRMSLGFGELEAEVTALPYHSRLHQLFYGPSESSKVSYRVRVMFRDPSVPALNLIYRILLAHWKAKEGDGLRLHPV